MKTKGQQPRVAKPELMAFCTFRGGLAERSNAAALQAVNGASPTVQGSESLTRRNDNYTPAKALTSAGARTAQPKPNGPFNPIIGLFLCDLKEISQMTCHNCRIEARRFGKHRNGLQRFRCAQCGKTYTEAHEKPIEGMTTPQDKALLAMRLLVEGNSIRSIERTTDLHRDTILRLLVLVGEKCEKLMGRTIVNVPVADVQCDEIWAFVQKKEGNKAPHEAHNDGIGDAYCFVAFGTREK